jgi:hypothetical protein
MNRKQLCLALFVGGPFLAFPTWRPSSAPKPDWDPQEGNSALLAPASARSSHEAGRAIAYDTLGRWERQFPGVRQTVGRRPGTKPETNATAARTGARLVLVSFSTTSSVNGDCAEPDYDVPAFRSVQGGVDGTDFSCSSVVSAGTECSVEETTGNSQCSVNDTSGFAGCSAGVWPGASTTGCSAINTSGGAGCSATSAQGANLLCSTSSSNGGDFFQCSVIGGTGGLCSANGAGTFCSTGGVAGGITARS